MKDIHSFFQSSFNLSSTSSKSSAQSTLSTSQTASELSFFSAFLFFLPHHFPLRSLFYSSHLTSLHLAESYQSFLLFFLIFLASWHMEAWFPAVLCPVTKLHETLCGPMECSTPDFSVHGILLARILEWVAISFSRGSSPTRDHPASLASPALAGWFFTTEPPGKPLTSPTRDQTHSPCIWSTKF